MSEQSNDGSFDILADVLDTLRFRGSVFFRSELASPWGMTLDAGDMPRFHIAFSGECFVGAGSGDSVKLAPNGIVLLINGGEHWIADDHGRQLTPSNAAADACALGNPLFQNGTITNRIMCGIVHYDKASPHPLIDALPAILQFDEIARDDPIWRIVTLIDSETQLTQSHTGPIIDRLTEVLFLQLLKSYARRDDSNTGFLGALSDRRVSEALHLIHAQPHIDWSLTTLGEHVGMSRATLVRHFRSVVGVAPMTYLANWRLAKAYNLVKYSAVPFDRIATTVGYSSAPALAKAFQRAFQTTPRKLRNSI